VTATRVRVVECGVGFDRRSDLIELQQASRPSPRRFLSAPRPFNDPALSIVTAPPPSAVTAPVYPDISTSLYFRTLLHVYQLPILIITMNEREHPADSHYDYWPRCELDHQALRKEGFTLLGITAERKLRALKQTIY
jgi:hypothetical protein